LSFLIPLTLALSHPGEGIFGGIAWLLFIHHFHCALLLCWHAPLPDATPLGTVRNRTADRIDGFVGDQEVGIGPVRPEGVVAGTP
jgi:hypothetical protein